MVFPQEWNEYSNAGKICIDHRPTRFGSMDTSEPSLALIYRQIEAFILTRLSAQGAGNMASVLCQGLSISSMAAALILSHLFC